MPKIVWVIISVIVLMMMFFCNRKVRLFALLKRQLKVFINAKSERFSFWDFSCFFIMPIAVSCILIFGIEIELSDNLAATLTTVFSLVFTILFGFATLLIGKCESQNKIEQQVIEETFVSIISATVLSLLATVFTICITVISTGLIKEIFWCFVLSISLMIIMLILLIIKRAFVIYCSK